MVPEDNNDLAARWSRVGKLLREDCAIRFGLWLALVEAETKAASATPPKEKKIVLG